MNVRPTSMKTPMRIVEDRVIDKVNNDANKIIQ